MQTIAASFVPGYHYRQTRTVYPHMTLTYRDLRGHGIQVVHERSGKGRALHHGRVDIGAVECPLSQISHEMQSCSFTTASQKSILTVGPDDKTELARTLPSPAALGAALGALGVNSSLRVIRQSLCTSSPWLARHSSLRRRKTESLP
jgi:hypothetical protein